MLLTNRWWIYQRERFPLLAHGPLVFAFSFSALCFSSLLRGDIAVPGLLPSVVAFLTALLLFLQLRIADEFKDYEEDCRYRPYRPVPRGLVSLRHLGWVAVVSMVVQGLLALWLAPSLLFLLLLVWLYLALMSKEFFIRDWLKARPLVYMWSHMLIMPLIDLYATACDWLLAGGGLPTGLFWFLLVSFFNGIVIEVGRKLRAPHDEEQGVETYTALWGARRAVVFWLTALGLTALCAIMAAWQIGFVVPVSILLAILLGLALISARGFLKQQTTKMAKRFELLSGIWTLLMYLSLGVIPMLWLVWRMS